MKLSGRTVLVTGATSGIGLVLTRKLSSFGCTVIAVGRSDEKLGNLKHRIDGVIPVKCNMSRKADVIGLTKQLEGMDVPVSILINNAAVQYVPRFSDPDFSFDSIETEVVTNFTSIAWLSSLLLPTLLEHNEGAAIVNMSSGLAIYPKTTSAIYSATKAAVHSLSQSLRYQLEDTGVGILEILLPLVDTAMSEGRGSGKVSAEHAADQVIEALTHNIHEQYVGKTGLLPIISRLSPSLTKQILKNS